jgi:ATP/maltotriose-dependent transcriptional regulator MalT
MFLAKGHGDFAAAYSFGEEAREIRRALGDGAGVADLTLDLGTVARDEGDYEAARAAYEEGRALMQALGSGEGAAKATYGLGYVAYLQQDLSTAQALLEEGLRFFREVDNIYEMGWILGHLAEVADARGDYQAAYPLLEESLAYWHRLRHGSGQEYATFIRGRVARHEGKWSEASANVRECLAWEEREGASRVGVAECLEELAGIAVAQGQHARAARLFSAAEGLRGAAGAARPPVVRPNYEGGVAAARAALGERKFAAAFAAGRSMSLNEAVTFALEDDSSRESSVNSEPPADE